MDLLRENNLKVNQNNTKHKPSGAKRQDETS